MKKAFLRKAFFLHDSISIADIINLNAGGRVDNHEEFGSHWTWDASASVVIPVTGTKLKASTGTGFKAPSLYQLYDLSYGNRNLDPETTFVYDAGVYQEIFGEIFSFDCTFFRQKYEDMIVWVMTDPMTYDGKYKNIDGKITCEGVEITSVLKPVQIIALSYGYTYQRYDTGNTGEKIYKRPAHKHAVTATLTPLSGLDITGVYLFVDERSDYFTSTTSIKLHSYHKFDMNIRYALNETITFTARGENLTDEDYEETYGYNTKGRSFYGGAEISL